MDNYNKWLLKVVKIAWVKYEIDGDILESYDLVQQYENGFSPRRTVEYIAKELFS